MFEYENILGQSIVSVLKKIFDDSAQCIAIEQRGKVLANVLNITIPIIITFSLFNFFYSYTALAIVQLASLLLVVPAWLLARRATMLAASEFLALFSVAVVLLYLIYDGGIAGLGFIWGWLFPFIAFYVAGIRQGWYWCIGFLTAASTIFLLSLGITATYDMDTRVLFFTAYFFYLIIGYWFNAIRFQYLFSLEKKVRARTAQIEYASLHDALTDMPNRLHITNYIQTLIDQKSGGFAVLNLDINRFSEINNVLGYDNGDQLLKAFAERVHSYADSNLFTGRIGGDEFVMVLHDLPAEKSDHEIKTSVLEHAKRLQKAMEQPYNINGAMIELEITIGVELPSPRNTNASHLISRANFACHTAKKTHDKVAVYDSEQDANSARQIQIFTGLKRAMQNDELKLFYQPKVDMRLGRVTDVEALLRWNSADEGLIPPNHFIPVAESTGLIHPVTRYVLNEAMRQQALWIKNRYHINIAINLSARNLMEPDFISSITASLNRHDVSPGNFTLEITESATMGQPEKALQIIHELKAIGFSLSLDDYGTGYTSLSYLKNMPVDELKIDQSFIFNCLESDMDSAIIQSTIALVSNLGLTVVAEGIENQEVWDRLKEMGCDKGQGYFIARPMPADEFLQWLKSSGWSCS
ncbi:MAG: EAL domain-containing protein [Mariprofundaceae bacterium]|nr:EAL domain-containing protein [Mariprofundaceae bacterium]